MVLVTVTDVYASAFVVPYLTQGGQQVTFGDLGEKSFMHVATSDAEATR